MTPFFLGDTGIYEICRGALQAGLGLLIQSTFLLAVGLMAGAKHSSRSPALRCRLDRSAPAGQPQTPARSRNELQNARSAVFRIQPDGGTARTDFPGGNAASLYDTIQKILALPDETRLFTGHDYRPNDRPAAWESTVAQQKSDPGRGPSVAFVHVGRGNVASRRPDFADVGDVAARRGRRRAIHRRAVVG